MHPGGRPHRFLQSNGASSINSFTAPLFFRLCRDQVKLWVLRQKPYFCCGGSYKEDEALFKSPYGFVNSFQSLIWFRSISNQRVTANSVESNEERRRNTVVESSQDFEFFYQLELISSRRSSSIEVVTIWLPVIMGAG